MQATLVADGTIDNSGLISIRNAHLEFDAGAVLTGGGQVVLSDNAKNQVSLKPPRHVLGFLRNFDDTISGAGRIEGKSSTRLINQAAGVVDADGTQALSIYARVENYGLIEATGAGGLTFDDAYVAGRSGGVVLAGDGSVVRLTNPSVNGSGLKLESVGSGAFLIGGHCRLYDISSSAGIVVGDEATLTLFDTAANSGRSGD